MEKALDIIERQAEQHHELSKLILQDNADTKQQLFGLVDRLTRQNSSALAEIAAPVGRTVKQLEHFAGSREPYVIDEPVAEAFRAKEEAEVGDPETLIGVLYAVDKTSGTCKLKQEGDKMLRCKITDPLLLVPNNVYTKTLNAEIPVAVTGKPVLKDGALSTFYISDAKEIGADG